MSTFEQKESVPSSIALQKALKETRTYTLFTKVLSSIRDSL